MKRYSITFYTKEVKEFDVREVKFHTGFVGLYRFGVLVHAFGNNEVRMIEFVKDLTQEEIKEVLGWTADEKPPKELDSDVPVDEDKPLFGG